MNLSLVIIVLLNAYCLSLVQAKNVNYNFENGNYGELNKKCALAMESVQEVRLLDGFNITKPLNSIYAYYSTKGHGCFQTNDIQLGNNVNLELEYYLLGRGEVKVSVKKDNNVVQSHVFNLISRDSWAKLHYLMRELQPFTLYTVSVSII